MVPLRPRRSSSFDFCRALTFFAARLPAPDGSAADASCECARHGNPDQKILEILANCDAGFEQDDPKEGEPFRAVHRVSKISQESAFRIKPRFVLDSGATVHAAGDVTLFSSLTPAAPAAGRPAAYNARDGRQLRVAGAGIIASESFHIPDVRFVPVLGTAVVLVSVQQLAERDYLVMFGGGRCHVKDRSSGELLGQGSLHQDDGLYYLDFLRIPLGATDGTDS